MHPTRYPHWTGRPWTPYQRRICSAGRGAQPRPTGVQISLGEESGWQDAGAVPPLAAAMMSVLIVPGVGPGRAASAVIAADATPPVRARARPTTSAGWRIAAAASGRARARWSTPAATFPRQPDLPAVPEVRDRRGSQLGRTH